MKPNSDSGSVAPLGIALLTALVTVILGLATAGHAALTGSRIQALADSAILYAHDRAAASAETEIEMNSVLDQNLRRYFDLARSVSSNQISYRAESVAGVSKITVCAIWQNPLGSIAARQICRAASAQSFEVSD